jgi:hypothetical protein
MLNKEELLQLEQIGRCQFNIKEAAMILQVEENVLRSAIDKKGNAEHDAYHGGRLKADFEVRQRILELAISGSTAAQELIIKLKIKSELDEV